MTSMQKPGQDGETSVVDHPQRQIVLEGAINFRDLGGYRTADGRRVKWKHLYRSDMLAGLSDADLAVVSGLKLRNLCDLRHDSERQKKPDRQLPDGAPMVHSIGFLPHRNEELMHKVKTAAIPLADLYALCNESYGRFHLEPTFARLFDVLLRADAFPTLIHCTSGKDRTGYAAALVLLVLGVPRDTIIEDFMLSNRHRLDISFIIGKDGDPEVMTALASVAPEYLHSAFRGMEREWGSEEGYIRNALRVSREQQRHLQDLLLE